MGLIRLPISILDKVVIYKMILLPKILYVFQNYLYKIPQQFFDRIRAFAHNFMWSGKQASITFNKCTQLVYAEGMGMVDARL